MCPCTAAGIAAVVAQALVPLNSSADASDAVPFEPPATSTWPLVSNVALCPWRPAVMLAAVDQLPGPVVGSKIAALLSVADPFLPPATRSLPLARTVAVWPSRAAGMLASVENADCAGSNRNTDAMVLVPLLPPASRTLLESCWLLVTSSVAVCPRNPAGGIGPVVAVHDPEPDAGL